MKNSVECSDQLVTKTVTYQLFYRIIVEQKHLGLIPESSTVNYTKSRYLDATANHKHNPLVSLSAFKLQDQILNHSTHAHCSEISHQKLFFCWLGVCSHFVSPLAGYLLLGVRYKKQRKINIRLNGIHQIFAWYEAILINLMVKRLIIG